MLFRPLEAKPLEASWDTLGGEGKDIEPCQFLVLVLKRNNYFLLRVISLWKLVVLSPEIV